MLTPTERFSLVVTLLSAVLAALAVLVRALYKLNNDTIRRNQVTDDTIESLKRHDEANRQLVGELAVKLADSFEKLTDSFQDLNMRQVRNDARLDLLVDEAKEQRKARNGP